MAANVFIVEDHPLLRQLLHSTVEKMPGLSVCGVARSAEDALEELENTDPDVAVIDLSLPQMSGIELITTLRERRPDLHCLILSGHKEPSYVEQALAAGAAGYVVKGDPRELGHAIQEVLAGNTYVSEPLRPNEPGD